MKRSRSAALVLLLAAGACLLLAWPTWARVTPGPGAIDRAVVQVAGTDALPVLVPLALVLAAASLAGMLVGPVARRIVTGVALVAAVGLVAGAITVLADPAGVGRSTLRGAGAGPLVSGAETEVTPWPWLVLVSGVLAAVAAVPAGARRGEGLGGRFDRSGPAADPASRTAGPPAESTSNEAPDDPVLDWDTLSRGGDPTDPGGR